MRSALLLVATLAACSGCSAREPEPAGIGKYRFNTTTLADVKDGRCQPTTGRDGRKLTWCFLLPPFKIGKRTADVDVYFLGDKPDAKLVEVQLTVRGCVEDDLEQWLRTSYGPSFESKGKSVYWKNSFLWMQAVMPSDPGRCAVHMLPLDETDEIARLRADTDLPAAPAGSAAPPSSGSGSGSGSGSAATKP